LNGIGSGRTTSNADSLRQDDVERGQPVGRHDQQRAIVDRVDVADLATPDARQAGEG